MGKFKNILLFLFILFAFQLTAANEPEFCKSAFNSENKACFATNQDYCDSEFNAPKKACVAANRSYCTQERFANSAACFGSHPAFCRSNSNYYASSLACVGAKPVEYCNAPHHSNDPICYGAMPAYCESNTLKGNDGACISHYSSVTISLYCLKFDNLSLCP